MASSNEGEVLVSLRNGGTVQVITLNRPAKKNSFTVGMYEAVTRALNASARDDSILVTVLTGAGDFYCSGTDLAVAPADDFGSLDGFVLEAKRRLHAFVAAFIHYPKLLVAVVNGPAIGIAATTLALFDFVYASEKAYLQCPFTKLGLSPEGCSSYTFPKLFGAQKATDLLLLGYKMPAAEALRHGLVTETYSSDETLERIWTKIENFPRLPQQSLLGSKRLMKTFEKDSLMLANDRECDELEVRWKSEEFMTAIVNFMSKASKL